MQTALFSCAVSGHLGEWANQLGTTCLNRHRVVNESGGALVCVDPSVDTAGISGVQVENKGAISEWVRHAVVRLTRCLIIDLKWSVWIDMGEDLKRSARH